MEKVSTKAWKTYIKWNNLAAVYAMQGRWTDAEKSVNRSIAIIDKNKITGHPVVASTQVLLKKIQSHEPISDSDGFFNSSYQIAFLMRKFY